MKRFVVLTTTVLVAAMGLASHPAAAKPPGQNGRILFVQDTKDCDDCISKSIEPDGTGTIKLPGSAGRYSPDGTQIEATTLTARWPDRHPADERRRDPTSPCSRSPAPR